MYWKTKKSLVYNQYSSNESSLQLENKTRVRKTSTTRVKRRVLSYFCKTNKKIKITSNSLF